MGVQFFLKDITRKTVREVQRVCLGYFYGYYAFGFFWMLLLEKNTPEFPS